MSWSTSPKRLLLLPKKLLQPFHLISIALSVLILFLVKTYVIDRSWMTPSSANSIGGHATYLVDDHHEEEELFSCGGGPFSSFMASMVSQPCDRTKIHHCCESHDLCYESRHLNQSYCDEIFCDCLASFPSSLYCGGFAQPGLCMATQMFGHMFHWSANCQENPNDCLLIMDSSASEEDSSLEGRRPEVSKSELKSTATLWTF